MFYIFVQKSELRGETRHIVAPREGYTVTAFEGSNTELAREYEAWLAEGNEPGVWPPEEMSE